MTETFNGALRVVPWRMCRTCHRVGQRWQWRSLRCSHEVKVLRGECGQCGKMRPLVECHSYDFREKPQSLPLPRPPRTRKCPRCKGSGRIAPKKRSSKKSKSKRVHSGRGEDL